MQLTCEAWLAVAQESSCLAVAEGAGEAWLCPVVGGVGALQAQPPVVAGLCHTLVHVLLAVLPGVTCHETLLSAPALPHCSPAPTGCAWLRGGNNTPRSAALLAGSPQALCFLHYGKYRSQNHPFAGEHHLMIEEPMMENGRKEKENFMVENQGDFCRSVGFGDDL